VHKTSKNELSERYGFSSQRPLIIFTQHAVTTEFGSSMGQIQKTLDALKSFNYCEILAFFSNTDAGGKEIIEAIKKEDNFTIIPNMVSSDFLSLMACADVMVGNSSAAIREAPSFQLPAINIGTRQQGRLRAVNVIDVNHEKNAIIKAIDKALNNEIFKTKVNNVINPYGDGNSATKIVDVLEDTVLDEALVQKRIAYEL
jgi:UDP-N-acetylglucosamine 2-epimerase (non-hydrolysing)/GDP/UDP-N,N'-diacetylbacillosamine 2-epimerase (hydrolysing)